MSETTTHVPVLVTTKHRGVFFGFVDPDQKAERTLTLEKARCAIRFGTKDGFLELAKTGPTANSRVGAEAPSVLLHDITSVTDCTEAATKAWVAA
jgi:hypothetical protein